MHVFDFIYRYKKKKFFIGILKNSHVCMTFFDMFYEECYISVAKMSYSLPFLPFSL